MTARATATSPIRFPRADPSRPLAARAVARAYSFPIERCDGRGATVGVISLGGTYDPADMRAAGLRDDQVTVVAVEGNRAVSDGAGGADAENALDVQVVAAIAPGAAIRMYSAANSDRGFLAAIRQAVAECDTVTISWGSPETQWSKSALRSFSAAFAAARARGVPIFAAAGDAGSRDGTSSDTVDYPAADPNVIGCGGTELRLDVAGVRASETVWHDDDARSATGGGVSRMFPGRQVPDVAGNADPDSGWLIVVGGQQMASGGTSAVAPCYAGLAALLKQATGGARYDLLNTLLTNPTVCYDVTVGDNGGYRAGPGRDQTTGFGVVDGARLLAVLTSGLQVPAPGGQTDPPPVSAGAPGASGPAAPTAGPSPATGRDPSPLLRDIAAALGDIVRRITAWLAGRS